MNMGDISSRIAKTVRMRGVDMDEFRSDVLELAHETARCIAVALDPDVTGQLKAALQFLYGLADGITAAPDADEGDAKPDSADGYPQEPFM